MVKIRTTRVFNAIVSKKNCADSALFFIKKCSTRENLGKKQTKLKRDLDLTL